MVTTFEGFLKFTICDAKNLKSQNYGKDPYCKVSLGSSGLRRFLEGETLGKERFKTHVFQQGGNPIWNETTTFNLKNMKLDSYLKIALHDKEVFRDDFLGLTRINLDELVRNHGTNRSDKHYYDLLDKHSQVVGQIGIIAVFDCTQMPQLEAASTEEKVDQVKNNLGTVSGAGSDYVPPVFDKMDDHRLGTEQRRNSLRRNSLERPQPDSVNASDALGDARFWTAYTVEPGIIVDSMPSATPTTSDLEKTKETGLTLKEALTIGESKNLLTSQGLDEKKEGTTPLTSPLPSEITPSPVTTMYTTTQKSLDGQSAHEVDSSIVTEDSRSLDKTVIPSALLTSETASATGSSNQETDLLLQKATDSSDSSAEQSQGILTPPPMISENDSINQQSTAVDSTQLDQNFVSTSNFQHPSLLQSAKQFSDAVGGRSDEIASHSIDGETKGTSLLQEAKGFITSVTAAIRGQEQSTSGGTMDASTGTQLDQNSISKQAASGSLFQQAKDKAHELYIKSTVGEQTDDDDIPTHPQTSEVASIDTTGTSLLQKAKGLISSVPMLGRRLSQDHSTADNVPNTTVETESSQTNNHRPRRPSLFQTAKEFVVNLPAVLIKPKDDVPDETHFHPASDLHLSSHDKIDNAEQRATERDNSVYEGSSLKDTGSEREKFGQNINESEGEILTQ